MDLRGLRRRWLSLLVFFQIYLGLSVVLFFFGPWPWEVSNPGLLAAYLVAAQVFIAFGYLLAWSRVRASLTASKRQEVHAGCRFLKRALFLTFVLAIPTSLSRTGNFLPDVLGGLTETGASYAENLERLEFGNPFVFVEYLRMLLSPMLVAILPLTVIYWQRLSPVVKLVALLAIGFNVSIYLATGTNKGFADIVITLPWLLVLAIWSGALSVRVSKLVFATALTLLFVAFLQYFAASQLEREGGVGEFGILATGLNFIRADTGHAISLLLSDSYRIIFESLTRYIGQGYYALSLSFQIDHPTTFGLGHSMFLARNADAIFSTNYFTSGSIPGQLELVTGWGMFSLWHSIYPWLASDVGLPGALFVVGALAYLLGLAWGRSLTTLAAEWITLLYLLLVLFFYIPGNNQIFQTGETCLAFFLILFSLIKRGARLGTSKPLSATLSAASSGSQHPMQTSGKQ